MPLVDGALEPERAAHRDHGVADLDVAGVPELERLEERRRRIDLDHGEVGRAVGSHDRGRRGSSRRRSVTVTVPPPLTTCWFVTTCPCLVEDEARALSLLLAAERRAACDRDLDDCLVRGFVDRRRWTSRRSVAAGSEPVDGDLADDGPVIVRQHGEGGGADARAEHEGDDEAGEDEVWGGLRVGLTDIPLWLVADR